MDSLESTNALYETALANALNLFRTLISSEGSSTEWKHVPPSSSTHSLHTPTTSVPRTRASITASQGAKKKREGIGLLVHPGDLNASNIKIWKKNTVQGAVVKASTEVDIEHDGVDLEAIKAVLVAAEIRPEWDKFVESSHSLGILDCDTSIIKTDYRLGWPASPRDTITINRAYSAPNTLIRISTSVPVSKDAPVFLRPSPPYVRANINLVGWLFQIIEDSADLLSKDDPYSSSPGSIRSFTLPTRPGKRLRVTLFSDSFIAPHNSLFSFPTPQSQVTSQLVGLINFLSEKGDHFPLLSSWGSGVDINREGFERGLESLSVDYTIIPQDQKKAKSTGNTLHISLPATHGWNLRVAVIPVGDGLDPTYKIVAETPIDGKRVLFSITHPVITSSNGLMRVKIDVGRLAGGKHIRVNGKTVETTSNFDITPFLSSSMNTFSSFTVFNPPSFHAKDETSSILSIDSTIPSGTWPTVDAATSIIKASGALSSPSTTIPNLLRRNYIYFTSLLQEPIVKWNSVADSRGVTISILQSPDPTLTIYRAEATFVGVGVWDLLACICTPSVAKFWDSTIDETVLPIHVGELSRIWWTRAGGSWLVTPRDTVTVRTAYKSPTSVHVFSFSTDDSKLFPGLPEPSSGSIRAQVDLQGWAIEALSPTTTQITLIDQSDWKGWANKSWTPNQMINAVAGIGEYVIKHGGPPIITRLTNAVLGDIVYDEGKSAIKFEYVEGEVDESEYGESGKRELVQCELRCDASTWANSIDLVVDPPPARVLCLSRHKLSSGGGLWITIDHSKTLLDVGGGRVTVVVKSGPTTADKGSVMLNGTKVKVDCEVLPDGEVEILSRRKRIKTLPIPLDQYSTLGHRNWISPKKVASNSNSPDASSIDLTKAEVDVPESPIEQPPVEVKTKPVAPISAFESLAWLQAFHAEQGPELADPAPGWSIVSERLGVVVRKKFIPRISDSIPVHRGDKIVQGLTAVELASVIKAPGCRKIWDDRVENVFNLSSYGYGCNTLIYTTKASFPFKGRVFYVSSAQASFRVPSASASASTSTVIFIASASFEPTEGWIDESKVNPNELMTGKILLEGWILETLDPYTSAVLPIPSTRCTYVSCIDNQGSMLAQSVLNPSIARVISTVEGVCKTRGPVPRLWIPETGLQIEGPLNDDEEECVWRLSHANQPSTCLGTEIDMDQLTFRGLFIIKAPKISNKTPSEPLPPKRSSLVPSLPLASATKSEATRSSSLAFTNGLTGRGSRNTITLIPETKRSTSPASTKEKSYTGSKDMVIAEFVVDLKQYPNGYEVTCASKFRSESGAVSLQPFKDITRKHVPMYMTVHDAPPSAVVSTSSDSSKRHLVRILVPSSTITNPIHDPLRDESNKPAIPEWFTKFTEKGAIVDFRLGPIPKSNGMDEKLSVTFNEEITPVMNQRDTKRHVLARLEDDVWCTSVPTLSRVAKGLGGDNDGVPKQLKHPLGIVKNLLAPVIVDETAEAAKAAFVESENKEEDKNESNPSDADVAKELVNSNEVETENSNLQFLNNIWGNIYPRISSNLALRRFSPSGSTSNVAGLSTSNSSTNQMTGIQPVFSMRSVVVVALISFLLGSLLRSLLTPADFIFQGNGDLVDKAVMEAIDPTRRWKEAKRLLELRTYWLSNWDFIVAVVKKS